MWGQLSRIYADASRIYAGGKTRGKETGGGLIESLSDELILQIFKHLPYQQLLSQIPRVCSRWKAISKDDQLWRTYCLEQSVQKENEGQCWWELAVQHCKLFLKGNILKLVTEVSYSPYEGVADKVNLAHLTFDDHLQFASYYLEERQTSKDRKLAIWDISTGKIVQVFEDKKISLEDSIWGLSETYVVVRPMEGLHPTLKLYHRDGHEVSFNCEGMNIVCHPKFLVVHPWHTEIVLIYNPDSGEMIEQYRLAPGFSNTQVFNGYLICRFRNSLIKIYDFKTGHGEFVGEYKIEVDKFYYIVAMNEHFIVEIQTRSVGKRPPCVIVREQRSHQIICNFTMPNDIEIWNQQTRSMASIQGNIVAIRVQGLGRSNEEFKIYLFDIKNKKQMVIPDKELKGTIYMTWNGPSLLVMGVDGIVHKWSFTQEAETGVFDALRSLFN